MTDVCPCHGEPWYVRTTGKRECSVRRRAAATRYRQSEKGRVANARHRQSEKCRATRRAWKKAYLKTDEGRAAKARENARYGQTENGRATRAAINARVVRVGQWYVGMAPRPEQAADLNQMARDRFAKTEASTDDLDMAGAA